jgi:hypothetical protein
VSGSRKRGWYGRQVAGRPNEADFHVAAWGALGEAAGAEEGAEGLEAARRVVATEPRILGPADSGTPKFLKDEMFSGQAPSFL